MNWSLRTYVVNQRVGVPTAASRSLPVPVAGSVSWGKHTQQVIRIAPAYYVSSGTGRTGLEPQHNPYILRLTGDTLAQCWHSNELCPNPGQR